MKVEAQFLQGLRWMALSRAGAQLVSWVGTIYVMRLLAPQDYGLAAICTAVLSIVSMATEFGIAAGIVQAERLERAQLRSVFGAAILFSFTGAVAVALLAAPLADFFRAPEAAPLIGVTAVHLLLAPLSAMSDAQLRRELRFKGSSIVELVFALATTLATTGLAWRGAGVWALILGPIVGSVVRILALNLLAPLRFLPSFDLRPARPLIGFGLRVALSRIASYVFGQSDVLIAGRVLPKTALGEYSVAMHLAMLPVSKAMAVLNQVTYPVIAQLQRDRVDLRPHLLRGLRLVAYLVMPVLWGLAAISPWLIPALLGPGWAGAVLPMQIVATALPLRLLSVLLSSVIQGMGHAGLDLRNSVTGVLLLPCCFLLGAQFGAAGLAAAWLLGLPLLVALNLLRSREVLGFGLGAALGALARPAAFCMAMVLVTLGVGHWSAALLPAWPAIALTIAAAACAYVGLLWLLDRPGALQLLKLIRPTPPEAGVAAP